MENADQKRYNMTNSEKENYLIQNKKNWENFNCYLNISGKLITSNSSHVMFVVDKDDPREQWRPNIML